MTTLFILETPAIWWAERHQGSDLVEWIPQHVGFWKCEDLKTVTATGHDAKPSSNTREHKIKDLEDVRHMGNENNDDAYICFKKSVKILSETWFSQLLINEIIS
jgi:hypothetical protein